MASRRLDISSLLCDDPQPPFSPLDVLVHAATEERKRLEQAPPSLSPHPPTLSPQLHHYDSAQRTQLEYRDRDRRRREDDERRRFDIYERQQQEYELLKREELIREERIRADKFRELERRKLEEQRELERRELEHRELERRELIELERRRELDRRELERREHEQREFDRIALERQHVARLQMAAAVERQLDLERRREQERLDDLHRRQQIQLDHQPRYLEPRPVVTSPHPPSISHLISHSHSPRPADRHSMNSLPAKHPPDSPTIAIPSPSHEDPRPIKKRRYSESPPRPIPDDKELIARERDKMVVGELGYGRVESPAVAPSHPPRRPGSGSGHAHGRKVAVSDLLTVDKERPTSSTPDRDAHRVLSPLGGRRSPPGSQIGRAKAARKSDEHLLREPPPQPVDLELRKPKDEPKIKHEFKTSRSHESMRSPVINDARPVKPTPKELPPLVATTATAPAPAKAHQPRNQEDVYEWFLQQYEEDPSPTISVRVEPPHTPSPSLSPPASAVAPPSGAKSPSIPHRSPFTAAVSIEEELEELVSKPQTSNPITAAVRKENSDIDMELDVDLAVNELVENLEADDSDSKPKAMEVDVEDELLSLLDDAPKPAASSSTSSSAARRNPPSSAAALSSSSHAASSATHSHSHSHSHSHAVHTKQPQAHNRSASEAPHVSPVISNTAAAVLSPVSAVRHSSTRPTSERGSMPPPASTGGGGKKGGDGAGSLSTTANGASVSGAGSNSAAKKKKETKATTVKAKNAIGAAATTSSTPAAAKPKPKAAAKPKKGAAADAISAGSTTAPTHGGPTAKGGKVPAGVTATGRKIAHSVSASRSRSASVMPAGSVSVGPESDAVRAERQEEEEDSDAEANEDDKLYCVCKTKYDEDRFMIACDRCDEWYHTQCLKMPDLEVDLVDQFICPVCVEKNPHLNLRTTYKPRCLYGLRHPDPSSTKACHKAARGAFSKYCSDECGVKYMQSRIDTWAKKGGKTDRLWDSVKGAEKREGIVCAVEVESDEDEEEETAPPEPESKKVGTNGCPKVEVNGTKGEDEEEEDADDGKELKSPKEQKSQQQQQQPPPKQRLKHQHIKTRVVQPTKTKVARETERLNGLLDSVIRLREEIKRGMEIVIWRERLLQLATDRAETVGQCGWDQRLCMDDEEWTDLGAGVLESYEEAMLRVEAAKEDGDDADMEVDGAEEQWWCPGQKVCDRHQGWQTVRFKDVSKEKEKKEEALAKLTTREREIRKRIEDMLDPQNTNRAATNHTTVHVTSSKDSASHGPLKSSNTKSVNGHTKSKAAASAGDAQKKGKKRKAPAS